MASEQQNRSILSEALYRYHYGLGLYAVRLMRHTWRRFLRLTAKPRRLVRYWWTRRVVRPVHRFFHQQQLLRERLVSGFRELGAAARDKESSFFSCFFGLCRGAVRHYSASLTAIGRLVGPIVGAAALAVTVLLWSSTPFCLQLTYHGNTLGVIDNAAVYDAAAGLARGRVINADNSFSVDAVPVFSMTMQKGQTALSEAEVCDAILRTSGNSIAEGTGVYVGGSFMGALESREDMEGLLQSILDSHYDKSDPDQRADFVQKTETVDGLFPISTVFDTEALRERLTAKKVTERTYMVQAGDTANSIARKNDMTLAELMKLNPLLTDSNKLQIGDRLVIERGENFLQVAMIKTVRYTESIDYNTQTVYRDDKPVTYSKVTTKGQEGSQDVVAEVSYVDGAETGTKIVSTTVTKQPVTKVVEKGTKKVYSSGGTVIEQGDGIATGNMVWPVPVCRNVYQKFHRGHLAIDISSGPIPVFRKPCLAADGGTVVYAGWYYGYGYYVKIDHGNGLYTTYSHLDSLGVVNGQQVTRGQQIGRIGNTGYSQGPHLHFEVIKNGVKVNPLNYVTP